MDTDEMSDLDLLASALEDAMDAYQAGVIVGPALDSVAFERAERRAVTRLLRTAVVGDAA